MPSINHETMHRLLREDLRSVGKTIRSLGLDFPETVAASVFPNDLTEFKPVERRPDTVLHVQAKGGAEFLLVVEAQGKPDPKKRRSRPYYVAYLHEYRGLPVVLIVLCDDSRTSARAQETIRIGTKFHTSMSVQALVVGPHNVPLPGPLIAQDDVPLAVLGVITHSRDPALEGTLGGLAAALNETRESARGRLRWVVEIMLADSPAGKIWRELMSFQLDDLRRSPAFRKLIDDNEAKKSAEANAQGRVEERAETVLQLLDKRGVPSAGP